MNRFQDSTLTAVEGYKHYRGQIVATVRDQDGHLSERVATDLRIVAGTPNMNRLEKYNAAGRPEIVPFELPSAKRRAA